MGKRILNLYVDDEDIATARAQHMNLSRMFRGMIKAELGDDEAMGKEKRINVLKLKLTKLSSELELMAVKLKKADKELYGKRMKEEGWKTMNR